MMDIIYIAIIIYKSVCVTILCTRLSQSIIISMSNITNHKSVSYTRIWPLQVSLKVNVMRFILPCFLAIIKVLLST
ncbi:hypothetical protein POPTR_005G118650v4 [Populus trichocarpa]|nr:hypothetical protein POPTR_005G118650v4 [Populus trichocarpa]